MGREPLNEMQRSVIYRSVFVWMTLMFSTGAVTGSRKMKVRIKWLSRMGSSLSPQTWMEALLSSCLFTKDERHPSCSKLLPRSSMGKINSYGVNPHVSWHEPGSEKAREWSVSLLWGAGVQTCRLSTRIHHLFVVDGIILSKISSKYVVERCF